jgi:hypothetical protein
VATATSGALAGAQRTHTAVVPQSLAPDLQRATNRSIAAGSPLHSPTTRITVSFFVRAID